MKRRCKRILFEEDKTMQNFNLNPGDTKTIDVAGADPSGSPAPLQGAPIWATPSGLTVTPSTDGLKAVITVPATATPGVIQVNVNGKAIDGSSIASGFTVTIPDIATQLIFTEE